MIRLCQTTRFGLRIRKYFCSAQLKPTSIIRTMSILSAAIVAALCLQCAVTISLVEEPSRAVRNVFFYLQPQSQDGVWEEIRTGDENSLRASSFNPNLPTRFLIHGWGGDPEWVFNNLIGNAYRGHADTFNVITVDWSDYAPVYNYVFSRNQVKFVGQVTAEFIDFLHESGGLQLNNTGLVGISLGAHVSGWTGKQLLSGKLQSIVGLDPAGPLFSYENPNRLDPTDADYVEVISTNRGSLGLDWPLGQVTFFPNWGARQPGCGTNPIERESCSHARSVYLFEETITRPNNRGFVAVRCGGSFSEIQVWRCEPVGWTEMGGEPLNGHLKANGLYYLATNEDSPFALEIN